MKNFERILKKWRNLKMMRVNPDQITGTWETDLRGKIETG
jgi:hypothetical protein